jgi:hypothetical protein
VESCPWLPELRGSRLEAPGRAVEVIAAWLDVDPASFEVDILDADTGTMTPPPVDGQVYGG